MWQMTKCIKWVKVIHLKKSIIFAAVGVLLIALLAGSHYVSYSTDSAVYISNATTGKPGIMLSEEDGAEIIRIINSYGFWERRDRYYCDCYVEFAITIDNDIFSFASGHFHLDANELYMSLEREDIRQLYEVADRYLPHS